jgi:hypothetical protein
LPFDEDDHRPGRSAHIETASADGVRFQTVGRLTTNGMNSNDPEPSWADIACDPVMDHRYAVFNMNVRDPATTGNRTERGQMGVTLYRIAANRLQSGASPWQQLHSFDTNGTGIGSAFWPGSFASSGTSGKWIRRPASCSYP